LRLILGSIASRKQPKSEPCETLVREYLQRSGRFAPTESAVFASEAVLLASVERQTGRPGALLILCDSRGELVSSESFAEYLRVQRDAGAQRILLGIGPADGWSPVALAKAAKTISFGRITLPHELARAMLAEQVYRALTILAGHPYHSGH
jgi:23S rRNA (pseudouridine1915-N3)-methyltransferase